MCFNAFRVKPDDLPQIAELKLRYQKEHIQEVEMFLRIWATMGGFFLFAIPVIYLTDIYWLRISIGIPAGLIGAVCGFLFARWLLKE